MESLGVTAPGCDLSTAMRADVGKRVNPTIAITTDDHWFISNPESQIVTWVRYFFFATQTNPMLHEYAFFFQVVDFRRSVHESGLMMSIGTVGRGVSVEIMLQVLH